jgi:hypothetical protein
MEISIIIVEHRLASNIAHRTNVGHHLFWYSLWAKNSFPILNVNFEKAIKSFHVWIGGIQWWISNDLFASKATIPSETYSDKMKQTKNLFKLLGIV